MTAGRRRSAVALAFAVLLAACGTERLPSPADIRAVAGPWRTEPVHAPETLLAATEAACRAPADGIVLGAGQRPLLADIRGGGRIRLLFADVTAGKHAVCDVAVREDRLEVLGGGEYGTDDDPFAPPIAPESIGITSAAAGDPGELSMHGRVDPRILSLRIIRADGSIVTPSLRDGWFLAWWPSDAAAFRIEGRDAAGELVGEFEECGTSCP